MEAACKTKNHCPKWAVVDGLENLVAIGLIVALAAIHLVMAAFPDMSVVMAMAVAGAGLHMVMMAVIAVMSVTVTMFATVFIAAAMIMIAVVIMPIPGFSTA
ncbi:hypothetical protein FEM03_00160 [Phragmitibacter flavus]|uniref:Uncharacterized protein n=1 Tax=Phragmitibacter flavus TaxID=2576071 RepID=A0A5R8KJM9_9BACT|nr:hypothetical protein [Phragmitibacter flavus]TLD72528.1 hypothetical protein FEM03_00160 [Phragmitibacter flavus]